MKEIIITKGEWEVIDIDIVDFKQVCVAAKGYRDSVICHMYLPEYKITDEDLANANLFALAGNLAQLHDPNTWQMKLDAYERMKEALEMTRTLNLHLYEDGTVGNRVYRRINEVLESIASKALNKEV